MNLTRLAVRRPVGVTMLVAALILFGILSLQGIGLDLLPEMNYPTGFIVAVYPGADPQTVEEAVTRPIEASLSSIAGLQRLWSMSMENVSLVMVDFAWGSNLDRAFTDVQNHLDRIEGALPQGVRRPLLMRVDPAQFPVMNVAVSARAGQDAVEMTRRIEERVVPALQQIPGVASVMMLGGTHEEVAVYYDSSALHELGITPTLLYQILAYQNTVVPAGVVEDDATRIHVRAGRRIETVDDLRQQPLVLRQPGATEPLGLLAFAQALPVRLSEIAAIQRQPAARAGGTLVDGVPAVKLHIHKQTGENTVAVAGRVRQALAGLHADPLLELEFHTISDQSDLIRNSLSNVARSGAWGALLAVVVLLFFLRNAGSLAVVGVAIPLSALAAVAILHATGTTLNLLSLGGLALAVGMLVDNAIVVLENITRHRDLGKTPADASADGGVEIGPAVLASTVTTLAVFVPIATLQSLVGSIFRDIAIAVAAGILASLVVALTVVPAAAARWIARGERASDAELRPTPVVQPTAQPTGPREATDPTPVHWRQAAATTEDDAESQAQPGSRPPFGSLQQAYRWALQHWLSRRWPTLAAAGVLIAILLILPGRLDAIFFPAMDGGLVELTITLPPGTPPSETERVARSYQDLVRAMPEVKTISVTYGSQGDDDLQHIWGIAGAHEAQIIAVLHPMDHRRRSAGEIADAIAALPRVGDERLAIESDRLANSLGEDYFPGVTFHITGSDLAQLGRLSSEVITRLEATPGFRNVTTSLAPPHPEVYYRVTDRSFQGVFAGGEPLTAGQVGIALRHHVTGAVPTHLSLDGRQIPVVLRPELDETDGIDALSAYRVPGVQLNTGTTRGLPILDRIAVVERTTGPTSIQHLNRSRLVVVTAELDGIPLYPSKRLAQDALADLHIPNGYAVNLGGIHQVIDDSMGDMTRLIVLAVVLVFIVMAVLFESWRQPLILMSSIPLAAVGALAALVATGHPLSMSALIGLVFLIGIAVNNGIVMVDYINRLEARGLDRQEAIIEGSVVRLRPILMTGLTSFFAVLPLALGRGEGSEFQAPMAIAVCGGLIVSTFLSLFIVPGLLKTFQRSGPPPAALPLRSLCLILLVVALGTSFPGGGAAAAETPSSSTVRWYPEATVTSFFSEGSPTQLVIGAGITEARRDRSRGIRVAGGFQPDAPVQAGVHGSRTFVAPGQRVDLDLRWDHWLKPGRGSELQARAAWRTQLADLRSWFSHASGQRTPSPWSGRIGTQISGWQAGATLESPFVQNTSWERTVTVSKPGDEALSWLLLAGPNIRTDIARTYLHGGLLLQEGRYEPVLRLGSSLSLLPRGEIELSLAPTINRTPTGWPVFALGYHGPAFGADVSSRIEFGAPGSGFEQRAYLHVQPAPHRIALLATWTGPPNPQTTLGLLFQF